MVDIERLQAFLYLVMRDKLPCGVVAKIVKDLEKYEGDHYVFTNKHLAAYTAELCGRLIGRQPAGYVTENEENA